MSQENDQNQVYPTNWDILFQTRKQHQDLLEKMAKVDNNTKKVNDTLKVVIETQDKHNIRLARLESM